MLYRKCSYWIGLLLAVLSSASDKPAIQLDDGRFVVTGLSAEELSKGNDHLEVFVDSNSESNPPILGSVRIDNGRLIFQPRFPLQEGLRYRAVVRTRPEIQAIFEIPHRNTQPPARVEHVYPTTDRLPENQLKLYIHFSAPMSRGEAYRHLSLLDGVGKPVELPFLELEQELWDPSGTRFTVLFDPGRIKRGLVPHNDVGPALQAGGTYTLLIDGGWHDAAGRPLASDHRKAFTAIESDRNPPDPSKWTLSTPAQGGRAPLDVRFPESLDHALLERTLVVKSPSGEVIDGTTRIDERETLWSFIPATPWTAGTHALVIDTALEDLAGNRIGRPFDVDLFEPISRQIPRSEHILRFAVR